MKRYAKGHYGPGTVNSVHQMEVNRRDLIALTEKKIERILRAMRINTKRGLGTSKYSVELSRLSAKLFTLKHK